MMAALLLLGCLPGAAARRDGSSMPGAVARRDGNSMPGGVKLYERKIYSIDRSWRFSLCEDDACAQGSPASCPEGAWCAASLDDDAWRRVDVPHDFVVEGAFNNESDMAHGYLPYGVGLYRKALAVSAAEAAAIRDGSLVAHVEFDGAQTSTTAYLNGSLLGSHGSGYTNFRFPLSGDHAEALAAGAVLAARVDATQPDGWWYDGGGIYRHARLLLTPATHLSVLGGAYLPSTVAGLIEAGVADAIVSPRIAVASTSPRPSPSRSRSRRPPRDVTTHSIGARVAWKADSGLWLNGAPYKIRGAANHQDFAGVGVAVPDALQAFRVRKLKSMGANAWRTAHNAPTPALLDACDAEGMLVWDETHRNGNPGEQTRLVLRDRNHPSVVIWSICNEKLCETNDTLGDGKAAAALYRELDPSSGRAHAKNASMPFISSETSSAVSDRGEYASDAVAAHVSGYDTTAPSWGEVAEDAWGGVGEADAQGILTRPFISGGFTWTGFDYKGEPTPYSWPNINSHFGILDIAGFEKDRFYYYQSIFKPEPVAHLFPHWNWAVEEKGAHLAECEGLCAGSAVEVWAFTNGHSAELTVNGVSKGAKLVPALGHVQWTVDYAPGTVAVVVRDAANATVASDAVETTGPAAALRLSFKDGVGAGGIDADCGVALVQVEVVDAEGRVVPTADANVTLASSAALRFIGGGNGDPSEHTADKSASRPAFHGLLLGVFEATGGAAAAATVTATAAGFDAAGSTSRSSPAAPRPTGARATRRSKLERRRPRAADDARREEPAAERLQRGRVPLEGRAAARRLRGERLEREEVALRRGERPEVEGARHVDVDAVALLVEDAEVVPARARRS
ncbi:arogenate dehydratase [Aureococcus anophagefferens]|nr:arogenate dehydratase [Aureococcus anophagefferens]